jgi:eukaryotic-like serine/threonine-protein kinase
MLKYFKSREFWLTLGGIVVFAALLFVIFFFVFLPSYTNHGEETEVPNVSKMKLEEAIVKLEEAGLRYEVADSLYLNNLPPLSIISQDPVAKSKVKPGRPVFLTVNKVVAPMVKFPDIVGVSQYQAKLRLEGANLIMGRLKYVAHEYRNLVLGASLNGKKLSSGDTLRKGSIIDLVVGEGTGNQKVEVPDLVGKSYESAIAIIQRLGLNLSAPVYEPEAPKPAGTIVRQHPNYASGDSIHLGSEINLWIAGPEPDVVQEGVLFDSDSVPHK